LPDRRRPAAVADRAPGVALAVHTAGRERGRRRQHDERARGDRERRRRRDRTRGRRAPADRATRLGAAPVKPAAFRYERPESVEEAVSLLAEHGDEAKVLAGGQSLVPVLNMRLLRPSVFVDMTALPLGEVARENGSWRVGALVRQADRRLLEIPLPAECLP